MIWKIELMSGLACAAVLAGSQACKPDDKTAPAAKLSDRPTAPAPAVPAPAKPAPPRRFTPEEQAAHHARCTGDLNRRDWNALGNCYAEDVVRERVDSAEPAARGRAAAVEQARHLAAGFPDLADTAFVTLVNGDQVVSLDLVTGTHTADLDLGAGTTLPATGKRVGFLVGQVAEYGADNLVHKLWVFTDMGSLLGQLGQPTMSSRPVMSKLETEPGVVIAKGDDTERKNLDFQRNIAETWGSPDRPEAAHKDAAFATYTNDVVDTDVGEPTDRRGQKALFAAARRIWDGFPDASAELVQLWAAGDYTVVVVKDSGTNRGDIGAWKLAKTGKPVTFRSLEINRWEGGKVKRSWMIYDSTAIARQLGVVPAGGPRRDPCPASDPRCARTR